jgi:hypothetical protein
MSPNPAFSGDAAAFSLNYRIQNAGSTPLNCAVIAVDQDGHEIPVNVVNMVINTDGSTEIVDSGGPVISDVPEPIGVEPDMAGITTGMITGTAAYQSRAADANIIVELLANEQPISQVALDANGTFRFTDVIPQTYVVKVSAPHHLPIVRSVIVAPNSQPIQLAKFILRSGDVDSNLAVDIVDASLIGANFGVEATLFPDADLNGDGTIDVVDLVLVGSNFGLNGQIVG